MTSGVEVVDEESDCKIPGLVEEENGNTLSTN